MVWVSTMLEGGMLVTRLEESWGSLQAFPSWEGLTTGWEDSETESALIAIKPNCNISSGRFALCKLSANLVLKSVNIDTAPQQPPLHHSPSHVDILDWAPSIEPAPALDTDSVTESSQPVVNPFQLGNAFTDPQDSSSLVTNIPPSNIAATHTIAAIYSTPPVSQRTRSKFRHQPYPSNGSSVSTNDSPLFLQSQARALPLSMVGPLCPTFSPLLAQVEPPPRPIPILPLMTNSPIASRVRSRRNICGASPLSTSITESQHAITGAIPKNVKRSKSRFKPWD